MSRHTLQSPARHAGLALELVLAGPAVWKQVPLSAERQGRFRQQMETLLDLLSLAGLEADTPETRRCLREELRSARRSGLSLVEDVPSLARLLALRTPRGEPLVRAVVDYFSWRESADSPASGYDPDSWRCLELAADLLSEHHGEVEELLDAADDDTAVYSPPADPEAAERLFQLGLSRHLNGEYRQAAVYFTAALKLAPADARLYAYRGDAFRMECEYERALADFHASLSLVPANPSVLVSQAAAYFHSGDHVRAVADCDAVLALQPENAAAYRTRAAAYAELGSADQALADLGRVIELAPEDDAARYQRGLIYVGRHEYALAVADFDRVLDRNPHHVPAWLHRGHAHRGRGDYANAVLDYSEVLRHHPDNVPAYTGRALAYRLTGDRDRAIADYTEALRREPENARVYYARGVLYRSKGDLRRARVDLDEAVRRTPENWRARYHRGKIALAERRFADAFDDFTESLSLNPGLAVAYLSRALLHDRAGRFRKGIEDAGRAAELAPESAAARLVRGILHGHAADHAAAVRDLSEAVRIDSQLTLAYQERGLAYTLQAEYDLALADCSRVIELDPGNARAYAHRSVLCHLKGEEEQSLEDYSLALRLDPRCVLAGWNPASSEEARLQITQLLADYVDGIRHQPAAPAPQPRKSRKAVRPAVSRAAVEESEGPVIAPAAEPAAETVEVAIEELLTDAGESSTAIEITEAPAAECVASEPPPPPPPAPRPAARPERSKRPKRIREDEGDSFLEKWKKPGLTAAGGLAALVLVYFCLPANLFGRDRPRVHPARGQLLFEEKPLPDANIVLAPAWTEEPNFPRPHATVAADGSFVLGTFGKDDGAPAGEYKVLVTWFEKAAVAEGEGSPLPKSLLPPRYGKFSTSGLTLHIGEGENQNLALKLTR